MGNILLQIFIYLDIFLVGVIASTAIHHAYSYWHPPKHEVKKTLNYQQYNHLPTAMRDHILESAQLHFQTVLDRSAAQMQKDLQATEARLTKQLDKLGTAIVGQEMNRFHTELDKIEQTSETVAQQANTDLAEHQTELKVKLDEAIATEKQQLLQQIDTKLADAVASFLMETMQHNVDLGAQEAYIMSMLDEHKADFKREVTE